MPAIKFIHDKVSCDCTRATIYRSRTLFLHANRIVIHKTHPKGAGSLVIADVHFILHTGVYAGISRSKHKHLSTTWALRLSTYVSDCNSICQTKQLRSNSVFNMGDIDPNQSRDLNANGALTLVVI